MAILELEIGGRDATLLGLTPQRLTRLGPVVALAGANGSGKSRTLRYVRQLVTSFHEGGTEADLESEVKAYTDALAENQPNNPARPGWEQNLDAAQRRLLARRTIVWSGAPGEVINFVPAPALEHHASKVMPDHLKDSVNQLKVQNSEFWGPYALGYVQHVQDRWFNATHGTSRATDAEKSQIISEYEALHQLFRDLMHQELGRDLSGFADLDERTIETDLSSGQRVLLQLVCAIHARGSSLRNSILLFDEPENHLHPAALTFVVDRIREVAPDCQLWIATHSIPLLADIFAADQHAIKAVEAGEVTDAGKKTERVLQSLIGSEEGVAKLQGFLALPRELAAINFAAQCFLAPAVAEARPNDPQLLQIIAELVKLSCGRTLKVLDYGAGKCRLLAALKADSSNGDDAEGLSWEYFAYDEFDTNVAAGVEEIESVYGAGSGGRYSTDLQALVALHGKFDVVVMTNVVHELQPSRIVEILGPNGLVDSAVNDDGKLLVVEDQVIPVGEKAHEYGFLLFDTPDFLKLFQLREEDVGTPLYSVAVVKDRLKAHLFDRSVLRRIGDVSLVAAIKSLCRSALLEIRRIRGGEANYSSGLALALHAQMHANAALYLQDNNAD